MKLSAHYRLAATALAAGLVLTACGQKPGVHVEGGGQVMAGSQQNGGAATNGSAGSTGGGTTSSGSTGSGASAGSTGGGSTGGSAGSTGGGSAGGGSTGGGDAGGERAQAGADQAPDGGGEQQPADGGGGGGGDGGDQPPADDQQQQQQGQREVTGQDRTGVTDESITVAFHAPVTGAAPLPAESFREARDLYWRQASEVEGRTFLGREKVEVLFQDDKYDPANARQVCRQLSSQAFIVAGGGGTDQIQACGQLAGVDSFPYFSAGVTEAGLENNPWYFASSMTYRQQGMLLAQYIAKAHSGRTFGAIITDTANFNDAVQGFEAGIEQAGISGDYAGTLRHSKNDSTWYNQLGNEMKNNGVEVLYILTSPVDYIQFAQQNKDRDFQYVGVGVSMGLNAVLGSGCPEVDGGQFFSPFPGLDWARDNVPEFFEASETFGTVPDDLALALWGVNKQLDLLFQRYEEMFGTDLTREDFRALVEGSGRLESGIFPAVEYSPENHFGGQSVHLLEADCGKGEHVTKATFATGF